MRRSLSLLVLSALVGTTSAVVLTPRLVKDINPNSEGASSEPESFVSLPRGLSLFVAGDGDGWGLWRSDGTAPGTFRVTDACEIPCSSKPQIAAVAGNRAFFWKLATFGSSYTLWVSNGSPAGTFRVSEPLAARPRHDVSRSRLAWHRGCRRRRAPVGRREPPPMRPSPRESRGE